MNKNLFFVRKKVAECGLEKGVWFCVGKKKLKVLYPLFIRKNADLVDILLKKITRFTCLLNFFYTIFVVQPATVRLVKTVATENKMFSILEGGYPSLFLEGFSRTGIVREKLPKTVTFTTQC